MASSLPEYSIRLMKEEDIPDVLDLWRETGLSEGSHSVDTWFLHDPEGFYVAVSDQGEVMGVCAGILQNPDLAFIGMYAVKSGYQRRGVGTKIWNTVMSRIGDRNAGVNPVPNQLENYRDKAGFPVQTSWCSVVCVAREVLTDDIVKEIPGLEVHHLTSQDAVLDDVIAYDADVNGFCRNNMVPLLCVEEDSVTMVAVEKCGNVVCGYGNIKKNIKGNALVGPLYADRDAVAELIFFNLLEAFPLAKSEGVTMMIVDENREAMRMTAKLGFEKQPGIARLYRKEEVHVKYDKIFGQHNLNFSVF